MSRSFSLNRNTTPKPIRIYVTVNADFAEDGTVLLIICDKSALCTHKVLFNLQLKLRILNPIFSLKNGFD